MEAFVKGHAWFVGVALILLLLSILCRFITGVLLNRLIRAAENMSATENKLLKQCKLKFQNCYQLNHGAVNVPVFVEKFLHGIRLGKCRLGLLDQFSGQFLMLSVFASGLGACIGLAQGETLGEILPFYALAALALYLHFSVTGLVDVAGKREVLKTTVTDFLENRMTERIRSVERDSKYLEEEERRARAVAPEIRRQEALAARAMTTTDVPADTTTVEAPVSHLSGIEVRLERQAEKEIWTPAIEREEEGQRELEDLLQEFLV